METAFIKEMAAAVAALQAEVQALREDLRLSRQTQQVWVPINVLCERVHLQPRSIQTYKSSYVGRGIWLQGVHYKGRFYNLPLLEAQFIHGLNSQQYLDKLGEFTRESQASKKVQRRNRRSSVDASTDS